MQGNRRDDLLVAAAGMMPVVWIALKLAPYWEGSVFELITQLDTTEVT